MMALGWTKGMSDGVSYVQIQYYFQDYTMRVSRLDIRNSYLMDP